MTAFKAHGVSPNVKALSLCVLVFTVAVLAAAVEPARACSCIQPDPWSYLEKADGAFVGRLVSRRESGDGRAVLSFSVERAVKGKIGATIEVETASSGAACGIETSVGRRIGLFLVRESDGWFGHLCWQVEPADLLAAAALPRPNGKGPVAMFVGGRFGPARTLALDAKGRTLAYRLGGGRAVDFSVCPGHRRVAELVDIGDRDSYTVVIRELPTLRLVRRQELRPRLYADSFGCASADGEQIAIFSSDTGANGRLWLVTPGSSTRVWRGSAFYASFRESFAYIQVLHRTGTKVVRVDLRNRKMVSLGAVAVYGAYQLVLSPAGTRLAGDAFEEGCRTAPCAHLLIIDLRSRPIAARTVPIKCCGYALWLRDDRFAFFSEGPIRVYDEKLHLVARVSGWNAPGGTVSVGSTVFGLDDLGRLVSAKLPGGEQRVVRRFAGWPETLVSATG